MQVSAQDVNLFKVLKLEGHQVRWSLPADGGPRVITYRLVTETVDFPAPAIAASSPLDGCWRPRACRRRTARRTAAAFAMWEAAANIIFNEAPEGAPADILIGAQAEPDGWAFADVFYDAASPEAVKPISQALVCLNPGRRWKVGFDGDLKPTTCAIPWHTRSATPSASTIPIGGSQIMRYRYEERFRALQPGDIHGAALLYGAPARSRCRRSQRRRAQPRHDAARALANAPGRGRLPGALGSSRR